MGWYYFLLLIVSSVQDVGLFAGGYKVSEVAVDQATAVSSSHRASTLPNFTIMTLRTFFICAGLATCAFAQSTVTLSGCHSHDGQEYVGRWLVIVPGF